MDPCPLDSSRNLADNHWFNRETMRRIIITSNFPAAGLRFSGVAGRTAVVVPSRSMTTTTPTMVGVRVTQTITQATTPAYGCMVDENATLSTTTRTRGQWNRGKDEQIDEKRMHDEVGEIAVGEGPSRVLDDQVEPQGIAAAEEAEEAEAMREVHAVPTQATAATAAATPAAAGHEEAPTVGVGEGDVGAQSVVPRTATAKMTEQALIRRGRDGGGGGGAAKADNG